MTQASKAAKSLPDLLASVMATSATPGSAHMLPEDCYTSVDFFAFEQAGVFARSWICVGRAEDIPDTGDYLAASVAGEPILVTRSEQGIHVMSAVCQHRGHVLTSTSGSAQRFRCPAHFWTYDLNGKLLGAPRMGTRPELESLCKSVQLPPIRHEIWHGFIFVNLDAEAAPLAPTLAKLEPFWANYEAADLASVPPVANDKVLPWNWKLHLENFTDAYHPEFVHGGTHDFAPSVHPDGGVAFTDMAETDNAIVRSVPLMKSDGGMNQDGWGETPAFPPIATLAPEQRKRLTFAMIPPSMTLMFSPNAISYQIVRAVSAEGTTTANDRVSGGGWLLPKTTLALADFKQRAARVQQGGGKIWAQDLPINLAMQAGKHSRFASPGRYGPLELTLQQFNAWLLRAYKKAFAMP
ncbi:MAG: hypothetical protein JWN73_4852 [Betaproteobacteria bacterium]|nr:hypothetical protein [Betaproteobacteria bacterium]